MNAPVLRQHGDINHHLDKVPEVGRRIDGDGVALELIPAQPAEVHFRANTDVVTLSLGQTTWVRAYDSDKLSNFTFLPGCMSFQPEGSQCYARSDRFEHEMLVLFVDKPLREDCVRSFEQGTPVEMDTVKSDLSSPNALPLTQLAQRMHLTGQLNTRLAIESMALLLFNEVLIAYRSERPRELSRKTLSNKALGAALDFMDASLMDNPGLSGIAASVGMSPYHFARSFKACMGVSPHQYVLDLRLSRARVLLSEPSTSLADVAYSVGFSSQAHMTDVFRKRLGVTPGKYRSEINK